VVEAAAGAAESPADLVDRLRPLYPDVAVSERLLSGEPTVFYVYRDGSFAASPSDEWWREPGVGYAELDAETGTFKLLNDELTGLLGINAADLVGHKYTDLLLPEARPTADELWRSVLELANVRSEVLVRTARGETLLLEFRAVRQGDVVGVHYRPTARRPRARAR
jgi:PAS domain-containing protein